MQKLIEILKNETHSLKEQYLQMTEKWAAVKYEKCVEMKAWKVEQWAKFLGVGTSITNEGSSRAFLSFEKGFYNSRHARVYDKEKRAIQAVVDLTLPEFLAKRKKEAEEHYENSILKLADRIDKKGLNIDALKATTSHINVNIETVLTDGVKTVKAFTIIASGAIQCPHYRYLIK